MKYMGSKSRIKKYILPILQEIIDKNNINTYVEPFCGGCNVIDDIICDNRIANDKSAQLVELMKHVKHGGELPEEVPKELYDDVRNNKDTNKYPKWFVGAIGFLASYNGRYFDGGYAKTLISKDGKVRNYYDEAKRNLLSQAPKLEDVIFDCGDYRMYNNINCEKALIYCDPPYKDTKQYGTSKGFNHDEFWQWVRDISKNNIVVVSEQQAPEDFKCIWSQEVTRTQDNAKRIKAVERMFTYEAN